jgi:hypothetical protein
VINCWLVIALPTRATGTLFCTTTVSTRREQAHAGAGKQRGRDDLGDFSVLPLFCARRNAHHPDRERYLTAMRSTTKTIDAFGGTPPSAVPDSP